MDRARVKQTNKQTKAKCWAREISFYIPLVMFQSALQKLLVFFTLGKD